MTGFTTRVEVTDTLTPGLARLAEAAINLAQPMAEISEAMLDHTDDRYFDQVDPTGVPWKPSKRAIKDGGRTLYLRGDLQAGIDRQSGENYAQVGVIATGGPAIYARRHQLGDDIMPQRAFLGIEARDLTVTEQIILDHLGSAVRGEA